MTANLDPPSNRRWRFQFHLSGFKTRTLRFNVAVAEFCRVARHEST